MKKILLFLSIVICVMAVLFSCESSSDIILTERNQGIADTIYSNISMWERKGTETCRYTYFQRVGGVLYFECVYTDNQASTKYRISGEKLIKDDYLKSSNSFVTGSLLTMSMPDYNINATREEKRLYVENLVKEMQDPQKWHEINKK